MKFSIKTALSASVLALLFLAACKKTEVVADVITYELTLKATKSTTGTTNFTEIKYTDGNKAPQTIANLSTDFSTKFVVTEGFPINFSVKGTATSPSATALPTPIISYKVEKITNGTTREDLCNGLESSIKSANGGYSFETVFTKAFSSTGCK